jgi:phospholipid/cholesterol/gamma-HCH transport system substrate-binding protein
MRKLGLNRYERVAGLFILVAIVGTGLSAVSVAVKQGWFEPKVKYTTTFVNADGVHAGTAVKISGLTAGSVEEVELLPDNRVRVSFHIMGKFTDRIRGDSKAMLIRPFIIGDRVLEVGVGSEASQKLAEKSELPSEETMDLMTLISGKQMSQAMNRMSHVMGNLENVAIAFSDKDRMESIVRMFDRMDPLLEQMTLMSKEVVKLSRQATKDDNMGKVMTNVALMTHELNAILPEMNKQNPDLGKDLALLTHSLGKVTQEIQTAFTGEGSPDMPSTTRRMVEALNEATILMKAMQKSIFMRSSVREVKEEEAKDPARMPAATRERTAP